MTRQKTKVHFSMRILHAMSALGTRTKICSIKESWLDGALYNSGTKMVMVSLPVAMAHNTTASSSLVIFAARVCLNLT